jgi:hypothetical protein
MVEMKDFITCGEKEQEKKLLEGSQASPACPSLEGNVKVKMLHDAWQ